MPGTVADLFAGCGGLSLGLENAGFESVFVSELHPDAMATYLANRRSGPVGDARNQVRDIFELTRSDAQLQGLAERLRSTYGGLDLVVGGPPCQGFSGIGHRRSFSLAKEDIPSNHLYREMARFISAVGPRAFIFENVRGLITSRWTPSGSKGEIWDDVRTEFESIVTVVNGQRYGYTTDWALVHAKDYGVPQNRPRVLLVGIREDVDFVTDPALPASGLLPAPTGDSPDAIDVLGDLVDDGWIPGGVTSRYPRGAANELQRWYRLDGRTGKVARKGAPLVDQRYSNHRPDVLAKFDHMLRHGGEIPDHLRTKKFNQRVIPKRWGEAGPNITTTSLADDLVHFSQPRVPTVREWARLQTFPDWYVFEGNRTTGGRNRAGDPDSGNWSRAVPKYTQIGNAVPVLLGQAVGEHLSSLLGLDGVPFTRPQKLSIDVRGRSEYSVPA